MPDKTLPRSRRNRRLSVNLAAPQLAQLEAAKRPSESLSEAAARLIGRGIEADQLHALAGSLMASEARIEALAGTVSADVSGMRESLRKLVDKLNEALTKGQP